MRGAPSMQEYYHLSRVPLARGLVLENKFINPEGLYQFHAIQSALLEPPEVGAAVLKALMLSDFIQNSGNSTLAFAVKETFLEYVRSKEFPEMVSRSRAIFVLPTKEDATMFRERHLIGDDRPYLHTCSMDGGVLTANMQYVTPANCLAPMREQVDLILDRSRRYWAGERTEAPILECLAEPGTVMIKRQVEW